jgi:hypothetical protein
MPRKRLSPKAPCPCGSGGKYGRCCYGKSFDYLVDGEGNISKSIPMSDELPEVIKEHSRKFVERYRRDPSPSDSPFFDLPPLEHTEHFLVEAMKQAGIDPAVIYAFEKTGLLVTERNQHLISDEDRAAWEAAVLEYRAKQGDEAAEEDADKWF